MGTRRPEQQASKLIRMVRENGSEVPVTYRGTVVALLIPVERAAIPDDEGRAWAELDHLAAEIGARWPEGVSAVEAVA